MQNNRVTCHATKKIRYAVPVNVVDAISFHYTPLPSLCSPTMSEFAGRLSEQELGAISYLFFVLLG